MTTYSSLCEILVKNYQIDPDRLRPDTTLSSLGLDSLGVIELLFAIEDVFKVSVPDADAKPDGDFGTLDDLAAYLDRLIAADAARTSVTTPTQRAETDSPRSL